MTSPSPAPTYRIVFADDEQVSPCPSEVWTDEWAVNTEGIPEWEHRTGRKCKVVEERENG